MEQKPVVVFEDNHLLALNKPSGWLVQSDRTGDLTLLEWGKQYIKDRYKKPGRVFLSPVHRIDRPASGIVMMGRTSKGLSRMNQLVKDRKITKHYYMISAAAPELPEGTLEHFIAKKKKKNEVAAIPMHKNAPKKAKKAVLHYSLIAEIDQYFLIKVDLETGRPHQIRAQMSEIGCTILGDMKYGAKAGLPDYSIALHAYAMEFQHPVQKEHLKVVADPPIQEHWQKFQHFFEEE